MKKLLIVALSSAAFFATPASAEVTYDPAIGGFVGKGDVQSAYGWNNAVLQTEAGDVSFYYDTAATYDVTCEWDTVNSKQTIHHSVTNHKSVGVSSSIASTGRLKNQITGFILGAANTSGGGGDVPEVGDSCPQAHSTAVVTNVEQTSSGGGGLYVSWEGNDVLLQAAQ
jgi:hypothetical protein